ncbi:DUF1642 domain-containing protein [Lactococcus lactis]|uniref:DUF1642 domain-containing protein n=1 Tax=Lactococcus lactis TaxID=1358 RepID=UPI0020B70034|nr:DUF1642 domain-containing protein [Lactococcus lactis]
MTKEMKRPTSHISGNSIKPALSKAVEFYTDNNRQAYECIRERDEYIDYLEYELKQKDEYILKVENENSFMRDERTTFDSNGMAVEPKLQQQALPVVPDFVAEWYEKKKNKLEIAVYSINTSIDKKSFNDLTKIEKWFEGVENKPIETIFKMKDGYTVEKPQLFYLENKITGMYLSSDGKEFYEHHKIHGFKFTQSEIDSMETGSYEQIEVVE